MEVFALDMAVREVGAAQVERSLGKMRAEAQKVNATTTRLAANATKGGLALSGMARNMVATGNAASLMSGGVVEAGGHIAMMFGPQGILVAALGVFVVTFKRAWDTIKKDTDAAVSDITKSTQRLFTQMNAIVREEGRKAAEENLKLIREGEEFVLGAEQVAGMASADRRGALDVRGLTRLREELARYEQKIAEVADLERRWRGGERGRELAASLRDGRREVERLTPVVDDYSVAISDLERLETAAVQRLGQIPPAVDKVAEAYKKATEQHRLWRRSLEIEADNRRRDQMRQRSQTGAALPGDFTSRVRPLFTPEQIQEAFRITEMQDALAAGIAGAVIGGFTQGIAEAIASGNIGQGFAALSGALLSGLGGAMVEFGQATMVASALMDTIKASLMEFLPGGSFVAGAAMVAIGAALGGVARRAFGGMGGARGGFGAAGVPGTTAAGFTPQVQFGATSATVASGLSPTMFTNFTVIGPNDPSAQRTIEELLRKAQSRGSLG